MLGAEPLCIRFQYLANAYLGPMQTPATSPKLQYP